MALMVKFVIVLRDLFGNFKLDNEAGNISIFQRQRSDKSLLSIKL